MHELIAAAVGAQSDVSRTGLVRIAGAVGLGARWPGQALLVDVDGTVVGDLLGGAVDERLAAQVPALLAEPGFGGALLELELSRDDADIAGLPFPGQVTVLVQPLSVIPAGVWSDVRQRQPTALLTQLDEPGLPVRELTRERAAEPEPEALARQLLRRGEPADAVVETPGGRVLVSVYVPRPHLLIIGSGALASAVEAQAALLGWTSACAKTAEDGAAAVEALGPGDGVLVLDHRGEVDVPVLATALRSYVGYVAALGSRRTQAARAQRLRDDGVDEVALGRVRGPAGLDIGSRTPAEIAVAIVAEMLSVRAAAPAIPLRDGVGPINGPRR